MIPQIVNKYLKKYSIFGWEIEHTGLDSINNVIVIPVINEYDNIKTLLTSFLKTDNKYFPATLFLFVVNNSSAADENVKTENAKTLEYLRTIIKRNMSVCDELQRKVIYSRLKIGVVDASTQDRKLPSRDAGVGLARKIGMDLALEVFNYNSHEKKILICLDADCKAEKNYLTTIVEDYNRRNLSAAVINFSHELSTNEEQNLAIICYEIFIRYYVLGLKYAGSVYAFYTVGSIITCDYQSYIKAEGMNKRKAGEDFYFMEKLAKNVKVEHISGTTVHPSSRISLRVPFGTGQRIKRFLSHTHNEYLLYNPASFRILKEWIKEFNFPAVKNANYYLSKADDIDENLFEFLKNQNFSESWKKILKNSSSDEQAYKQKIKWFDGFRTLKLIHYLRDSAYPMVNMFDALDEMFKTMGIISSLNRKGEKIPPLEIQKEYLNILQRNT